MDCRPDHRIEPPFSNLDKAEYSPGPSVKRPATARKNSPTRHKFISIFWCFIYFILFILILFGLQETKKKIPAKQRNCDFRNIVSIHILF